MSSTNAGCKRMGPHALLYWGRAGEGCGAARVRRESVGAVMREVDDDSKSEELSWEPIMKRKYRKAGKGTEQRKGAGAFRRGGRM